MKAILRSINNFSCKLKQNNNLKYDISPKVRSNKFKSISGNGNVVIEDAIKRNLKDYKIYGNTCQNSTSGKNLINYIDKIFSSLNGLTNVINEDGSITTTGVPTSNYVGITSQYDIIDELEDGQTYTISSETQNQYVYVQINAVKIAGGTDYIYNGNSRTVQFTVNKSKYSKYNLKIQVGTTSAWGTNSRTITNKYQLEKGGTATEFEPYTGGQPSPSPEFNQKIVSCGDRAKNLLDINLSQSTSNATKSVDGNNLTITCNANNQNCYVSYDTSNINPNKTYYFSYTAVADNYAGVMIRAYKNDNTYEVVVNFTQTTEANLNFKVPDNTVNLRIFLYASRSTTGGSIGNKTVYSNVHLGEEPYGYKIPVNVRSENLLNLTNLTRTTNGLTISINDDEVNINGTYTGTGSYVSLTTSNISFNFNSEKNYIFSIDKEISQKIYLHTTPLGEGNYENFNIVAGEKFVSFNPIRNYTEFSFRLVVSPNTPYNLSFKLQLKEGNTPTKFQPYYNQTTNIYLNEPLRKIDGYSDYIDFKNGKIVRNIGEVILNGSNSEQWVFPQTLTNTYRFLSQAGLPNGKNVTAIKIITNKFINGSSTADNGDYEHIRSASRGYPDYIGLNILKSRLVEGTLEAFKTWLSSNPITVDYILETPTEENIELSNINLIEGKNIITIGTEVFGVFEIEYYSNEFIDISNYKYNLRKVED